MNPKNITFEPFSATLDRLERGRDFFIDTLKRRDFLQSNDTVDKKFLKKIVIGEKERIPHSATFALRLVPVGDKPEWLSVRTRTIRFNAYIDCMTRASKPEIYEEMSITFTGAVREWMQRFEELSPAIPDLGARAYNSWVDDVAYGWNEGQVWRIGRISFWMDVQSTYIDIQFPPDLCQ